MPHRRHDPDRFQLWCLMELAGSVEGLLEAERHLSLLFARRPTLRELVDELLERQGREGLLPAGRGRSLATMSS